MRRRLFDRPAEVFSVSAIDLFAGAVLAVFILLVVYMYLFKSGPEPLAFLEQAEPPPAIGGQSYVFAFPVTGGAGERTFELAGALPSGLTFDRSAGVISGVAGVEVADGDSRPFQLRVRVRDQTYHAERNATLLLYRAAVPYDPTKPTFALSRTMTDLPTTRIGEDYEAVIGAVGGVEPYYWNIVSGTLPSGLALLQAGRLIGRPTTHGIFDFSVEAHHTPGDFLYRSRSGPVRHSWMGDAVRGSYRVEVLNALEHRLLLPAGRVAEPYVGGVMLRNTLGTDRVQWEATVPGLTFSAGDQQIQGTPTQAGSFEVRYAILQRATRAATGADTLRVMPVRMQLSVGPAVFQGWVGEPFNSVVPYRGGYEPIVISILSGSPPNGLTLRDGVIMGTPSQPGLVVLRIRAEDEMNVTTEGSVTIRVGTRY